MLIIAITLLTFALGPTGSIPYALAQGLPAIETAILISAVHILLVPIWFGIFTVVNYDDLYHWRITSQMIKGGKKLGFDLKEIIQEFERRTGQFGFGLGIVGFTFLLGISWAALGASILNLKKRTILVSVAVGAVASTVFWTAAFSGALGFFPSPWVLYVITGLLTLFWIINKKLRYRKVVSEMDMTLRRLGVEMGRRPRKKRKKVS
ncbi:MAG: hypothetical protein AB1305_01480 [Candidatus Hadarchaeota archaeon]